MNLYEFFFNRFYLRIYFLFIENKYDLIVMDPPWENKSAKRKKR